MYVFIVPLLFTIKASQVTQYQEIIYIPPGSFIHLSSAFVPDEEHYFNPGYINSTMLIQNISDNPYPLTYFNLYVFPNSTQPVYPCVVNQMLIKNKPLSCPSLDKWDCSGSNLLLNNTQLSNATVFTYCNLNHTNYSLVLTQEKLNTLITQSFIFILENLSNGTVLHQPSKASFLLTQTVAVTPSDQFYEITLGLVIALGILVILLTSVLCIFNYKYQKVKEQNITLNLVRGESNPNKSKLDNKTK